MSDRSAPLTRRGLLIRSAALGCSLAASPFLTRVTFASAPFDNRLVVIILRGGMDGLDVVRPHGDVDFAQVRPNLAKNRDETVDLGGFFALHPALTPLAPLWRAGELAFAHAVSTPYRDKRSHFDGQDLLEAGAGFETDGTTTRDGWLNRLLQTLPGVEARTGFAIGREQLMILNGAAPASNWSPGTEFAMGETSRRLLEQVYHDDPLFRDNAAEAMALAGSLGDTVDVDSYAEALNSMQANMRENRRRLGHEPIAAFAVERLLEDTRIAAFSLGGWDTHNNQQNTIRGPLEALAEVLVTLKSGLGDIWGRTTVLAMTEFGRTVRENGTRGTDHGTAGVMLMAGGAIDGGRVYGTWPGLSEADLYQRRDLLPTADVRTYAAAAMQGLYGVARSDLEGLVFPGIEADALPRIIA